MYDINSNITAAPRTKGESVSNRRARKEEAKRVISLLAERSPAAFVADKWAPHRPLKVGIHADLLSTGLLTPREVRNALVVYTGRLQYQRAVAAGGARVGLDGAVAGEVTQDQIEKAVAVIASIEAKVVAKAAKEMATEQQPASRTPPPRSDSTAARRDGLAELRRAALAKKENRS
jgi:sRNA-binding protein